jgi:lipopolysaccharide biosynthesis glycosyltransferase
VDNLTEALRLVDDFRHKYSRVVTDDLHAYLVGRSVGTAVKFAPDNPADLRFNGLLGIDDASFDAIRDGINDKLASTLSLVLAGADEEEVYAHWRRICAGDLEVARRRIADIKPMPPPSFDIAAACERIRSKQVDVGAGGRDADQSEVHVTVALDANLKGPLDVVLEALTTSCTRPLHVWILCRDHGPADFDRVGKLFPEVSFTWLPCDEVDYGRVKGMLRHTTAATMDRLLLPELLDGLERVVYIDIDMLPLADIAELADWDLDGAPLAASTTPFGPSGYAALVKVAGRQRSQPARGDYLLRWMSSTHPFDFPRFNAGVLVLDLAKMRDDDFCRRFIPWVDVYGMNDQVVLNVYAGSTHVALPPEWNHRPSHERIDEPKLIHWAGWVKPWSEPMAPLAELWRRYEAALQARVAKLGQSPGQ